MPSTSSKHLRAGALLLLMVAAAAGRPATAQLGYASLSARSGAMGGILLPDSSRHAALHYRRLWPGSDLADKGFSLGLPLGRTTLWAAYGLCRADGYNEQQAAAAGTMRLSERASVSLGLLYGHSSTTDAYYAPHNTLAADAALTLSVGRNARVGAAIGMRSGDEQHKVRAAALLLYHPTMQWTTALCAEADDRTRLRAGVEYAYQGTLFARAGLATAPLRLTAGLGLRYGNAALDLCTEVHSALGLTPSCSLCLWF